VRIDNGKCVSLRLNLNFNRPKLYEEDIDIDGCGTDDGCYYYGKGIENAGGENIAGGAEC
jgi:hypothetical protein